MSRTKRIINSLLAVVLCFAFALSIVGCNDKPDTPPDTGKTPGDYEDGTHDYDMENTDMFIMKNGATAYKILLPETPDSLELFAASELSELFYEATGTKLEQVSDSEMKDTEKYLSVGDTKLKAKSGVEYDYETLGIGGFKIVTKDGSVLLAGAKSEGTLYAVYQFLTLTLGFEPYDDQIYALDRGTRDIPLKNYNITDVPDIPVRAINYGYLQQNDKLSKRFRLEQYDGRFVNFFGAAHNSTNVISYNEYGAAHKEWFYNSGVQLDYTAGGDAESLNVLVDTVVAKMKDALKADTERTMIAFTHADLDGWADSKGTQEFDKKYGTGSAAAQVIVFCNRVRKAIDEWFASEDGKPYERELTLYFFAYKQTIMPPVTKNAEGKYVPIDQDVVLADGVAAWIAPITADYTRSYYEDGNATTLEVIEGWQALGDDALMWTYSTNFNYYLAPFDTFSAMAGTYKAVAESKPFILFDQGQMNNPAQPTGWSKLKAYLNSKLSWNVNADLEQLTQNFFENYFGPAKDSMMQWFREYRLRSSMLNDTNSKYAGGNSIYLNLVVRDFWPKQLLEKWRGYAQAALDALEPLKTSDPVQYKIYSDNVRLERIAVDYLEIELYRSAQDENKFTTEDLALRMNEFREEALHFNLQRLSETVALDQLFGSWGLV